MNRAKRRSAVRGHQPVTDALADGVISESWAGEIAGWANRLPAGMREGTEKILLDAAAAGASFDDLKLLANAAWEKWKPQRPDPDDDPDGFDERHLRLDTTMDAWPGGCDKRPAQCDVHHVRHKKDGGPTSVRQCILLCQFHHDICIHRWGWQIELLPDGTTLARSPQGQIIRSHGPPPAQAAA